MGDVAVGDIGWRWSGSGVVEVGMIGGVCWRWGRGNWMGGWVGGWTPMYCRLGGGGVRAVVGWGAVAVGPSMFDFGGWWGGSGWEGACGREWDCDWWGMAGLGRREVLGAAGIEGGWAG